MGLSPAAAANSTAGAAAVAAGIAPARPVGSILGLLRVYHDLSKFKLSAFVVSTSTAGYVLGSGETVDWGCLLDLPRHLPLLRLRQHLQPGV